MVEFAENFKSINGLKGKVTIEHNVWGTQTFNCEKIEIINDHRIGVRINNCSIFVYKKDSITYEHYAETYIIKDDNLHIIVNVNKL